jgi:solute:Na+ symporter, SSS family
MTYKKKLHFFVSFFFISLLCSLSTQAQSPSGTKMLNWSELAELPAPPGKTDQPGLAGSFVGISNDALIIAGGANFPKPEWETEKVFQRQVYVLSKTKPGNESEDQKKWHTGFKLDSPIAYGASITTEQGIVCIGGNDNQNVYADVFSLIWNVKENKITQQYLPSLPSPCTNCSVAKIGNIIYLAGGQSTLDINSTSTNFWSLDLSKRPDYETMLPDELATFAKNRGIHSSENKNELTSELINSDNNAALFVYLDKDSLLKIAATRSIIVEKNINRKNLLQLIMQSQWGDFLWKELKSWDGPARAFNITVAQHNGSTDCIYVISGRGVKYNETGENEIDFLTDVYEFNPLQYDHSNFDPLTGIYSGEGRKKNPWRRRKDSPVCVKAGTGAAIGQSHVFIFGGADGSRIQKADELKDNHPGFPKHTLAYHTITDTWIDAGQTPANHVMTTAVKWEDSIIIPSGEIRPRVQTSKIWSVKLNKVDKNFGWLNFTTLFVYLLAMVGIGVYFAKKNKNTDDYFRGGQKIPWWAAGCSIYATMLSSITYMSVPAIAYATNWIYILGYPAIITTTAIVVYFVLPFFRQIDATSAYEYLERRFNRATRLIGSALFILFQIGRMAIVMFLSALALAAITPFSEAECILIMGILSIIYCTLGGIEAVIWTDTVQTFVLLGGALLIFGLVIYQIDGGMSEFFSVALSEGKMHMINWDWDLASYAHTSFWVLILGGMGQNLVSYTSDQAVVQRYMTTSDEKKAARAIWTNGIISFPTFLLFFSLGAALFVFYKLNPGQLDPTFKTDAIMPLFIIQEVPVGIAGLIVAGIFAAAQSTVSTSMNSTATAIITDFFRPFNLAKSEKSYFNLSRLMTIVMGVAGTLFALLFSSADIKSLFESFITVIGLFGGSLGGLFLLGMFTRRANGSGAVVGALVGAVVLYLVKTYTATHLYLYAFIGITTCFSVGYLVSLCIPAAPRPLRGLTIFTIRDESDK